MSPVSQSLQPVEKGETDVNGGDPTGTPTQIYCGFGHPSVTEMTSGERPEEFFNRLPRLCDGSIDVEMVLSGV